MLSTNKSLVTSLKFLGREEDFNYIEHSNKLTENLSIHRKCIKDEILNGSYLQIHQQLE